MAHSRNGGSSTSRAWAEGGLIFAATMLIIIGLYQILMGIAAIANGEFFIVGTDYVYNVDITAWGWIHLGIGVLCAVTGFFLFTQATWARWVGIALAGLSAVANFFFLPYYPIWSLVIIALDIFVIWSLTTIGRRVPTSNQDEAVTAGRPMTGAPEEAAGTRWPANPPTGASYDTTASKGTAQPAGTEANMPENAEQTMAGRTPPRPPTPPQ